MESSNVMAMKCGLIVWLFLSSLSVADSIINAPNPFDRCYNSCFTRCVYDKKSIGLLCPFKCTKACMANPFTNTNFNAQSVSYSSCELECATSFCTKFSTKENPAAKEVGRCVDSCSKKCSH